MSRRLAIAAAVVIIAVEPFLFWKAFAGDAQVHLVFMEAAAGGRWFEFNPGERVSGETSPGYMLLGALAFRALSPATVPVVLKIVGLLSWYLLCWLVYRVAARCLDDGDAPERVWPAIAALVAASCAGSIYNANVGMENGLFAAAIWLWIDRAGTRRLFESMPVPLARELALAALLGFCCWLRPEAFVITVIAYAVRLRRAHPRATGPLVGIAIAASMGAAALAFQHHQTGDLLTTSLLSRRVLAMPGTLALGPLVIDPTFAIRLLAYLPLTAFFVAGVIAGVRRSQTSKLELFLQLAFGCFFLIYTFSGAPHLARYVIFLMPVLAISAARGARAVWRSGRRRWIVILSAVALALIHVVELGYRVPRYYSGQLGEAIAAPVERRNRTDALLRALGNSPKRPVVVVLEGVQLRYQLDERIVVRSLDGRVDRKLFGFVYDGTVDHPGYLRAIAADFLLQLRSYNRDRRAWSLESLASMRPGDAITRDGITFRRLPAPGTYAITKSSD